jgi:predicted molibdopterin-dependent oxidoreductase YjgC
MVDKAKVKLTIDGKDITVDEGTTILDAAEQYGIHIPTLCHHAALSSWGGCRICAVEVDGAPRLVASCVMPVRDGMAVVTINERILEARRTILEFLFAERNHYCMFCAQSGDCELQSLAYELQMDHLTVPTSYQEFPVDTTDDNTVIDHNRCILCGRCVRACQEIAGSYVLNYQNRGSRTLIVKDLNEMTEDSNCASCGICVQVCPTGAIYDRHRTHYAVKGKPKDWQTVESICPGCGLLCPTVTFVKDNNILKIEGKLNGDRPDHGQLCPKGRFEPLKYAGKRLTQPMIRKANGRWVPETWEKALALVADKLSAVGNEKGGHGLVALASSQCSNEELFLLRHFTSQLWPEQTIGTLNGVPTTKGASRTLLAPYQEASWKLVADADFILVVGADPQRTQPVISSLIRKAIFEKKIKTAVIGRQDSLFPWTSLFIPTKEGDEGSVVKALSEAVRPSAKKADRVSELAANKVTRALEQAKLDGVTRKDFMEVARLILQSENPIILAGDHALSHGDPSVLTSLKALALVKGLLPHNTLKLLILKPHGNEAGALKLGLSPYTGLGRSVPWRAGLLLLSGEDIQDPSLLAHLKKVEFLAVIGPYFFETLGHSAHVLIPKPVWLEDEGTYTSVDGREFGYKPRVLQPPDGVRPSWESMLNLARHTAYRSRISCWEDLRSQTTKAMQLIGPKKGRAGATRRKASS